MNKLFPPLTFTPRLRLVGMLLALLALALVVVPSLYALLIERIPLELKYLLFPGASFVGGVIALSFWMIYYPHPEQTSSSQNTFSLDEQIHPGKGELPPLQPTSTSEDVANLPTLSINNPPIPESQTVEQSYAPPPPLAINQPVEFSPVEAMPTQQLFIQKIPELDPIREPQLKLFEFAYPKEGWKLKNSQDKYAYAYRPQNSQCRYAVADGVGSSFLPDEWAQILTNNFVARELDFAGGEDFVPWLIACSKQWYKWVDEQWIPVAQQRMNQYIDLNRERAKGAQATFIGCSLSMLPLERQLSTRVDIIAFGDCVLFLLKPPRQGQDGWRCMPFPSMTPDDFGPLPDTLATRADFIESTWPSAKRATVEADPGDIILLATDALAKWILIQNHPVFPGWLELLSITNQADFGQFVLREREKGTLDLDDVTLLVIYLQ